MADINIVVMSGRLTNDPELKYTQSGMAVCNLRLASNRKWKDKGGNAKEASVFITCVVWDKKAEACAEHLHKGSPVMVQGRLNLRSWEDKAGNAKSTFEIEATEVNFLSDGKPRTGAPEGQEASGSKPMSDDDIPF